MAWFIVNRIFELYQIQLIKTEGVPTGTPSFVIGNILRNIFQAAVQHRIQSSMDPLIDGLLFHAFCSP